MRSLEWNEANVRKEVRKRDKVTGVCVGDKGIK